MLVIGPHISISKGFGKAAQTAVDIEQIHSNSLVEIQEEEMLKNLMKRI